MGRAVAFIAKQGLTLSTPSSAERVRPITLPARVSMGTGAVAICDAAAVALAAYINLQQPLFAAAFAAICFLVLIPGQPLEMVPSVRIPPIAVRVSAASAAALLAALLVGDWRLVIGQGA